MTTKPLLLLAALTLCCCMASLHALPRKGCSCIRTISTPMLVRVIRKIEVIPVSGHCRRTEIIVTRKNDSKVCVDPNAKWVNDLLRNLQNTNVNSSSTTAHPLANV